MGDVSDTINGIDSALGNVPPGGPPIAFIQPGAPARAAGGQSASPVDNTISAIDAALSAPATASANPPAAASMPDKPASTSRPQISFGDVPADVVKSLGAGIETGAAAIPGLAGDVSRLADYGPAYLMAKGAGWLGLLPKGKTSDDLIKDAKGVDFEDPLALPTSAQTVGAVERAAGPIYQPKSVAGDYAKTFGEFIPGAGRGILTGALLPAVASETAGQITKGTGLEPWARVAGGITGAAVGGAVPAAVKPIASYVRPMTSAGQETIAARTLADATADVPATRAALDQPIEFVPGSAPTTFQQTGDLGLGQLERKQRMNAATAPAYIERDAQQNAARVDALQGVQPTGSPADVAARFAQLREHLDQAAQGRIDALRPAAQDADVAMGGRGTADSTGYALRQPMAEARAAAKQQEDALWTAVDPDGTLAAPMGAIKDAAAQVYGNLPKASEANLSADEKVFRDLAGDYRPVEPFAELQGLRSELSGSMRQELAQNGRTPAYARMSGLMDAVQRTISGAVEHKAAQEAHAVSTGAMEAGETIEARVEALRQKWDVNANAVRSFASGSLRRTGTDAGGLAGGGTGGSSSSVRATGPTSGRVGQAPSDPGVPQETLLQAAYDAAAAGRIRAASEATKQRAQTFDEGISGDILAPGGRSGQYRMPDAAVPSAVVPSGKATDALAVRQFLAAGGTPHALADATAYSIRSTAIRPDGTLDPTKVRAWITRNSESLAEMPPEVASRFRNVADAQAAVDDMVAQREHSLATFNKSAIARVANLQHGEDVTKTIGSVFGASNAVGQMKALATAAGNDPAAKDGLRRAIVEHMMGMLMTNASVNASGVNAIKGSAYLGFMKRNGPALRQVFEARDLDMMSAIGNDIDRSLRTHQTKGLTSSPGTAQDVGAAKGSILGEIAKEVGPAGLAMASHAAGANVVASGLGWLGAKTLGRMRAAGLANANDLVTKAMLDPALAKRLLAKAPTKPDLGTAQALGDQFVRLSRSAGMGLDASSGDNRQAPISR